MGRTARALQRPHESLFGETLRTAFARDGFVVAPGLTTPREAEAMRRLLLDMLAAKAGFAEGALFDAVSPDGVPGKLPQLINPSDYEPALRRTWAHKHAWALAKEILGPKAELCFEHFIIKPAKDGAETPWHQDDAFHLDPSIVRAQVTFWIALEAADAENGCLRYIPGSHQGPVLRHHSPNDDQRVHFIECREGFDAAQAVLAQAAAGDCVIHDSRVLHGAGPNRSARTRAAYALVFQGPVLMNVANAEPYPWIAARRTSEHERRESWLKRGGALAEIWRAVRRRNLSWARARSWVRRLGF